MTSYGKRYFAPPKPTLRKGLDGLEIARLKRTIKDFDWSAWEAAQQRLRKHQYESDEQEMSDLALVQAGQAKLEAPGIHTKDDMMRAVQIAYGQGSKPEVVLKATALLCWELQLSPNPGLGHVWVMPGKGGAFIVMIGIYGLIALARRHHEFLLLPVREMTTEERTHHGLASGDVGVIQPIVDMRQVAFAKKLTEAGVALSVQQLAYNGVGICRKNENVWATGSQATVAEKRALKQALTRLGLNSNIGNLPDLRGMATYDEEDGGYVISTIEAPSVKPDPLDVLEGEYAKQLQQEAAMAVETPPKSNGNGNQGEESPETPEARFERLKAFLVGEVGKKSDDFDPASFATLFASNREAEKFTSDIFGDEILTPQQESVLGFFAKSGEKLKGHIENWRALKAQAQVGETPPAQTEEAPPVGLDDPLHDVTLADDDTQELPKVAEPTTGRFSDNLTEVFPPKTDKAA